MTEAGPVADRAFYDKLRDDEPTHTEVPVTQWGRKVRIRRLSGPLRLTMLDQIAQAEQDEEGNLTNEAEVLQLAVDLIAASVVDEVDQLVWDDEAGRDFLTCRDIDILTELQRGILAFNHLSSALDQVDAAKKN